MNFKSFFTFPLKFRLITAGLFTSVALLLGWVYFCNKMVNNDISMLLNINQQESVQQLASQIDDNLQSRLQGLEAIARQLAQPLQKDARLTKDFLGSIPMVHSIFNGGLVAYNLQGVPVAVHAPVDDQSMANGYSIDYVAIALQDGQNVIGPLELNPQNLSPEFGMVVPVLDEKNRIVGALKGLTRINEPNFLSRLLQVDKDRTDSYLLVDPVRRLVVAGSDRSRAYAQLPLRGANPTLDALLTPSHANQIYQPLPDSQTPMVSKTVGLTGWVLLHAPSSHKAFVKFKENQTLQLIYSGLLLLLAACVVFWFIKNKILPIHSASVNLATQIKSKERWMHTVPDDRPHELREIIGGVNQLLSMLGQEDAELPQVDYFAKSLAENMPDVVGYWTSDLRCSYANHGYLQWFGYTPEQMQGMHIKSLLGDQLFEQNVPFIQAALRGENQQFERQIVQPNGKQRDAWVQYMVHKVQGVVEGFFVFMVDITQVKTRESMARISDAALRSISQGIVITDSKQRILLVNDAFTRITGYEKHEVISKNCRLLQGEESDRLVIESMEKAMAEGVSFSGELLNYRKDGSTFWNEMTISPVYDENHRITHYTGVVRDITARKIMEDERMRAKMQLERDTLNQSILNALPLDLAVINSQGVVLALNHPQQAFNSVDSEAVFDPLFPTVEGAHFLAQDGEANNASLNPYRKQAAQGLSLVLEGGANYFRLEYPIDTSAHTRWSSITISPLGREQQGAIVAHQDITDLKQAYLELQQATSVAEKANHAKSHFLATASHDLRQPLSALALYVGVLSKRAEPQQKELVDNIRGCVDSLSELLKDLLDVSKLDAGVVKTQVSDFLVDDILASHMAIQSVNASIKGLKLRMRPSGAVVRTDPKLLSRIVGNLVTNAIRYTHQGGVLLACRKRGNSWWLEVWDTGEGIPEDKHSLIFEEFQQLNQSGRTRGSGLGLAIVSKMAHLLGLNIHLRSRPGRGSVFAIELPAAHDPHHNEPVRVSQNKIPRPLRMAVVDDDSRVLRAMVMALQGVGHDVVAAEDDATLVQQLQDQAPDIIISDYRLGHGRTGFEAVAAVRKKFGKDDLPAILVTGDTDPALIRSMADQGIAVHYKPLQLDTLQAFVKESVERRLV